MKINERKINKKRKIFKRKIKWNANIKKEKETNYENEILENEFVAIFDCPNVLSTNEKDNKKMILI